MNAKGSICVGIAVVALVSLTAISFLPVARAQEEAAPLLAFVDKAEVAKNLDLTRVKEAKIERMRDDGEKKIVESRERIRKAEDELALLDRRARLARAKREELNRMKALLVVEEKNLDARVRDELMRATKSTYEAIEEYCGKLRAAEGYAAVLAADNTVVLAFDPALDVTQEVIRGMNQ